MTNNGAVEIEELIRNLHLFSFLTRFNLEERFVEKVTDSRLSFVQMNLMRVLETHPGCTVGNVAKYMNVSYPAATKTVDKLVRLGFLERKEDSSDRRIAWLQLTTLGNRTVDKYKKFRTEKIKRVLDEFGSNQTRLLNRNLKLFAKAVVHEMPMNGQSCMACGAMNLDDCLVETEEGECGYVNTFDD